MNFFYFIAASSLESLQIRFAKEIRDNTRPVFVRLSPLDLSKLKPSGSGFLAPQKRAHTSSEATTPAPARGLSTSATVPAQKVSLVPDSR